MERRLFIFRPGQTLFIFSLLVALLFGCGGGGGGSGGTNPPPNNPPPGGGNPGTPNTDPPSVVSTKPQEGETVSVDALIEITFTKPMDPSTFPTAIQGLGNVGYEAICVADTDCKIIRLSHKTDLEYNSSYTLTLLAQVRDEDGNLLSSPYVWSFETEVFVPDLSFARTTIDGFDGKNSGECTAIAVDSSGTVHIVYYSEEDGSPKHAFCFSNEDCSAPENWDVQFIESPVQGEKRGRDINLAIDGDTLHVSYRDVDPPKPGVIGDNKGVLKYVKGVKNGADWDWSPVPVIVDDTENGVTDTYIAFHAGSVHISYRKVGAVSSDDVIAYATCSSSCDSPAGWAILDGEPGNHAGSPNHIVVTNSAVYISYYLDGTMKYVTCSLPNDCLQLADWTPIIVDHGEAGQFDVGTENSLAVDNNGMVHLTYRDNTNGLLKYTRCQGSCEDPIAIDAAGGSSQIKVSGNVLHVSYRNDDNKNLKYAVCPSNCLDAGSWFTYTIDAPGEVGLDTYLAVETNGTVHISYRAAGEDEDLRYARGIP